MKVKSLSNLILILLLASTSFAQKSGKDEKRIKTPPPGKMSLLPGFEHYRLQGIDSTVGEITKKNGLTIRYDIGTLAGNYARQYSFHEEIAWTRELKVNGDSLLVVYLSNGRLGATFQDKSANFYAVTKSQEDVVDFLLTIMTYDSGMGSNKPSIVSEIDNDWASRRIGDCRKAAPPRSMSLLKDYEHMKCEGVDTLVGKMERKGGMTIEYDIGELAGNYAQGELKDKKEGVVSRQFKAIGDNILVVIGSNGKINATFQDQSANFMANTKRREDVVDFILIVMTYR